MNYTEVSDLTDLANFLVTDAGFIESFPDENVIFNDHHSPVILPVFTELTTIIDIFYIPKKKKGQFRKVFAIRSERLRSLLVVLEKELSGIYSPPLTVHGYVKKRSIKSNAENHLGKKFVLSVDIKNFFESISREMIEKTLTGFGFTEFASERLSNLVTVNGFLVQGFPTSAVISNMVVHNVDNELSQLCEQGVSYTRYSDDLYFSGNDLLPAISDIESILKKNGFELNPEKTKLMKRGAKQYVTGLTVFDRTMPRIPKTIKRNIRLEIHFIKKFGYLNHLLNKLGYSIEKYTEDPLIKKEVDDAINRYKFRLYGKIFFIKGIEKRVSVKFLDTLKSKNNNPEK